MIGMALLGGSVALAVAICSATASRPGAAANASVLQHHHSATRDGLYVEPALTRTAAASLHRDVSFQVPLQGPTYAQALFWASARPGDRDLIIAATEENRVYAIDASSGRVIWPRSLGLPNHQATIHFGHIYLVDVDIPSVVHPLPV